VTDTTVTTSVIIPVYNDPEGLQTTVESLLDQTVDDYEVIIADNGSTDKTRTLAVEYAREYDSVTHVIEDEIQSSYAARNAGIEAARGEILCFIDADMWVESTWLKQVQERMHNGEIDYIGCNVEVVVEDETMFAAYNQRNSFPVGERMARDKFAPTCCLVVRSVVVADVGRFDERLISGGDAEFGLRVSRAGYDQTYAEDITMYHPARSSLRSILKRRYRVARGQIQRARYHPERFQIDRHPLHPRNVLPVRPQAVFDSAGQDARAFLQQYAIVYDKKLVTAAGQFREWYWPVRPEE